MFYNLSKTNLIKRFHYMLTMLKVRSIIQKINPVVSSVREQQISCFSVKQLKALRFKN